MTRLPVLTTGRRFFRWISRGVCRVAVRLCTRMTVQGLENYPTSGPALITMNHLGDPDIVLLLGCLPEFPEIMGKIELRDIAVLRVVTDWLGVIWVHQGRPDRRAITCALEALRQGRRVQIAPEGRESASGDLEAGTEGAAFLATRAGRPVPIVPVTITGSEFRLIENNIKRFRRTPVAVTVGKPFFLPDPGRGQDGLQEGTRLIMEALARQLPPGYRGVYAYVKD